MVLSDVQSYDMSTNSNNFNYNSLAIFCKRRKLICTPNNKSVIANYVICKKQKAKHIWKAVPLLYHSIIRDAAIFEVIGIDFAEPLILQGRHGSAFLHVRCTRAVHFKAST